MQLVTANNLGYSINDKRLFHNLSFSLNSGCGLHIKGGNGSGKSTLLRIILGLTSPSKGSIEYSNPDLQVSYLGHKNAIKHYLTPMQNLELIFKSTALQNAIHWMHTLRLMKVQDELTANLSFGQQKKLALIRIFANQSDLIILDEPFVGLDNPTRDLLNEFLQKKLASDTSLILTSHIEPNIVCSELVLPDNTND
ncbi:heme ABC exporter ATP-binding protein CcmA [Gammaproteobacteria bacterium]|jgi:heme exporter protein A|nr:heme ABC exporter ATP-binding protein CcmA [Gammaproteobacteria bacterium]